MGLDDLNIESISFVVVSERLILSATSPPYTTCLYRLDGSEEMKLCDTTSLAYLDSILLASQASWMRNGCVNSKALFHMYILPVRNCKHPYCKMCKASNVDMAKVSFNVQATL